jgi:hypothetical protein
MCHRDGGQRPRKTPPAAPRARTGPVLCLDSHVLPELDSSQFGTILNGLGFDGLDLAVEPGGTVAPENSPVDMVRAIEAITVHNKKEIVLKLGGTLVDNNTNILCKTGDLRGYPLWVCLFNRTTRTGRGVDRRPELWRVRKRKHG